MKEKLTIASVIIGITIFCILVPFIIVTIEWEFNNYKNWLYENRNKSNM